MSEIIDRFFAAVAGRYRIEREIGSGGMATVYLARDLKHDRDVAVKVLRPELAAVLGINRFLNEIRISARLDHPHILTLIDSGVAAGFPFYVMPFVRGESLRAKLEREKQLGLDEALDITRQVASALDHAHRSGIIHRDIKPENILIREGEAVLSDFGIATAVKEAGGSRLTESGVSLGTPQYMSPEQASGDRPLDARSDVFSIAAVLYEMLAGEPPHTGASVQAVIAKLLTERPTRLRVIRDSVPEGVDSAVAKSLEKVPADRYASVGDFARALANGVTGGPAEPTLAASATPGAARRWIPLALGVAIALVAIAAAWLFSAIPALRPLPDQVQLTFTGNAIAPSLSPDGTRLAFAEKQCDSAGSCNYQLVIQDTDGTTGRLVVASNIGYIYKTRWISDGRLVEFAGSYPPTRHGTFAVSTLGGEPGYLGCCQFDLVSGDTSFLYGSILKVDRPWVKRITVRDGQTLDSIPVLDKGTRFLAWALTIPDRLILVRATSESRELRLIDFRGRVIDRYRPPSWLPNRRSPARWVASRQKLVLASQREPDATEYDILAVNVSRSGIAREIDTLVPGLQMGGGELDISADGERLVYSGGPPGTSLATIDLDWASPKRLAVAQVFSRTTDLRGRISSAGDRILLAHDAGRGGAHASQFSTVPRNGGSELQLPGAVENLLDFAWSPDGARIMYLHAIGGNKALLMERETTGLATREIARLEQSHANQFHPLSDGAVWIMPPQRSSISIISRPGKRDVKLDLPPWMSMVGTISPSADAKSLAVEGMNRSSDSVVVATVDIESGRFTRIGVFAGSDPQKIAWLNDGSIMFIFREPEGAWAFNRIFAGRLPERLGTLPHTRAEFSVSADGKHVAMFSYGDRNDVYMIRNFGEMLRR